MTTKILMPASANGHCKVQGPKNSTNLKTVTQGVRDAVLAYLDGTNGTHTAYTVEINVVKLQVKKP